METRYKLIGEETLKELIKCRYRQGYMILLLAALCEKNRIETDITLHEGCGILGLTPREVLDATKRNQVRFIDHGGHRLFNASDFAAMAEAIRRRKVLRILQSIPTYVRAEAGT